MTDVIDQAISKIQKTYGKESIARIGDKPRVVMPSISTGILSLDLALGVGGLPKGRICEAFGAEAGGKSTLALQVIAEAQRAGGAAAYIDMEHSLDPAYCAALGVDVPNLIVSQPDHGEQALEITNELITTGAVAIVVVDSVTALIPKAELEGAMGDSFMGLHARLMSQAMRKLTGVVSKTNTCLVFINQLREKIGQTYGDTSTTTGGRALKFYSSVRLDVRRIGALKDGDELIGARTKIKIAKNKVGVPFKEAEVDLVYGRGFCRETDILDLASERGLVEKSGAWYSYNGERIGQGRERAKEYLESRPEITDQLEAAIRERELADG